MPGVIELSGAVKKQLPEEPYTRDPKDDQIVLSKGPTEPLVSRPVHQEEQLGPATPPSLVLGTLNHPRLRLRRPLELRISREEGSVVASVPELEEFGYGPHLSVAIDDLRQGLVELYQTLEIEQHRLGPDLSELWQQMQRLIQPR